MSLAFDEYGRPFIILREQDTRQRMTGVDAIKQHILAGKAIAHTLKTSLGPKGACRHFAIGLGVMCD